MTAQSVVPRDATVYDMLRDLFGERWNEVWVASVPGDPNAPENQPYFKGGRAGKERLYEGDNLYFSGSCVTGRHRRKTDFNGTCVIWFDDIGSKVSANAVRDLLEKLGKPRWIVETSPGNQQWFYKLDRWIGKDEAFVLERVLHAAARLGLTDPGTIDVVRAMRLPGGINGKPKYGTPSPRVAGSKMTDDVLDLEEACAALGLAWDQVKDPDWEDGISRSSKSGDTGLADVTDPDPWLQALFELDRVLDTNPKQGIVDIVCPFDDEHTARESSGTAYFGRGAFKCHHGHCQGRKNDEFQAKIVELLDEELAPKGERGRGWLARRALPQSDIDMEMLDYVPAVSADFKEISSMWLEAHSRFVWVCQLEQYVDLKADRMKSRFWTTGGFNSWMARVWPVGSTGKQSAHAQFLNGQQGGYPKSADMFVYEPGAGLFPRPNVVNIWKRPEIKDLPPPGSVKDADIQPYLDHVNYVLDGDKTTVNLILDYMAYKIQKPGEKINWAFVIVGEKQGTGKDMTFLPLVTALGDENARYVNNEQLTSSFNSWLISEFVIVQELDQHDRVDVYDMLKPKIAAPPRTVTVNEKFLPAFELPNQHGYFFVSNRLGALALDPSDRRFFVTKTDAVPRDPLYYAMLATWMDEMGGTKKVIRWLMDRNVAGFNPWSCPPDIRGHKAQMVVAASSPAVKWVIGLFEAGGKFEGRKIVTLAEIIKHAELVKPSLGKPITDTVVAAALRGLGGDRLNDGSQIRTSSGRQRLWATNKTALDDLSAATVDALRGIYDTETGWTVSG